MSEVLPPLSADEITVLTIAAQGESMMPIGRWEKPCERLLSLRYLAPSPDKFNLRITLDGKRAIERDENESLGEMISVAGQIQHVQNAVRDAAEEAAKALAEVSRQSSIATGDRPSNAARQWGKVIIDRAVEILESGHD